MRWAFIITITLFLTYLSYRGLDVVGNIAIVVCFLSLLPFVVFCIIGSFKVKPSRWLETPPGGFWAVDWRLLLNTFFWNINYWESAASFSGDVKNPDKNYPRGMGIAVVMVLLATFIPVLIGTGISEDPYTSWKDGYFITLAFDVIGPWLGYWMMGAAAITNIGMFEAEMSSDAWQIAGMADRGILPSFLGERNVHGSPTYGILLSASGVICLGWMSFSEVIDMLNLLFCLGQAIEFCAFLHLRRTQPDMPRPFKVPIPFIGLCIMLSFPLFFIGIIISFSSLSSLLVSGTLALSGIAMFYFLNFLKEKQFCIFEVREEYVDLPCPTSYQ
jgi:amino acid transporter